MHGVREAAGDRGRDRDRDCGDGLGGGRRGGTRVGSGLKTRRRQAPVYLMRIKAVGASLVLASGRLVAAEQLPTTLPTTTTSISYSSEQYTGTMPTEFGRLTDLTNLNVAGNELTGRVPSEIGALTKMSSNMVSHGGRPSTVRPTRPASSTRFSRRRALAS